MRVPSVAGLRLDVSKAGASRRAGDADEDVATRAFNLPPGVTRVAFQRLVAVGTVEFEFVHSLHLSMRNRQRESMWKIATYFSRVDCACRGR